MITIRSVPGTNYASFRPDSFVRLKSLGTSAHEAIEGLTEATSFVYSRCYSKDSQASHTLTGYALVETHAHILVATRESLENMQKVLLELYPNLKSCDLVGGTEIEGAIHYGSRYAESEIIAGLDPDLRDLHDLSYMVVPVANLNLEDKELAGAR